MAGHVGWAAATHMALAILAKYPAPGQVKTRLSPPLAPAQAADLARAFLLDKVAQVRRISGVARVLAFAPPEAAAAFQSLTGDACVLIPQDGADLGERLSRLSERLFSAAAPAVAIIGTDSPTLRDDSLREARDALTGPHADVVLGPTEDGGYYLIGLRRPAPALFRGIPWSTERVLRATRARARAAGLRVHLLPVWYDVDTEADLRRLIRDLSSAPDAAPRTADALRALRLLDAGGQ
jgi:hypothetical protein